MSSSDLGLSTKIAQKFGRRLNGFGYRTHGLTYSINNTYSVKNILFEPQVDIQITDTNSFVAKLDARLFAECLQRDFAFGALRFNTMFNWMWLQNNSKVPSAWLIVCNYYTLFFLANELLRAGGKFIVYFDKSQIDLLQSQATTGSYVLNQGTWCGMVSQSDTGEVIVRFSIRNGGHHDQVWSEIGQILSRFGSDFSGSEKSSLNRIVECLGSDSQKWIAPNLIRNKWNYSEPELFGKTGEVCAKEFQKHVGNYDASLSWANRKSHFSNEHAILGMNYTLVFLKFVYSTLLNSLLSDSTLKELREKHGYPAMESANR